MIETEVFMNQKIKSVCSLPVPYPRLRVEEQNASYAKLLSIPYASNGGELASILFYTYGHLVTASRNERLSELLRCISITEMRHFEILGSLIVMLGGSPRLWAADSRGCFGAQNIVYSDDSQRIIRTAISMEREAAETYKRILGKISDGYVAEILQRIILDEEHHIKLFSELQENARR